jgi:amino acid efflux transporter
LTLGRTQGVALYAGVVLGSGVLVVPAVAAELAGPASLVAWGAIPALIRVIDREWNTRVPR